jgi:hypothetical protein
MARGQRNDEFPIIEQERAGTNKQRTSGVQRRKRSLDVANATDIISDDTWREPVAKYFKGEIIVGKDLMVV